MNEQRHLALAITIGAVAAVGGAALLALPAYRDGADVRRRIDDLSVKAAELDRHAADVERLADALYDVETAARAAMKTIPDAPDVADLMRRLSLPVDGVAVRDQTFTAGSAGPATDDAEVPEQRMPLTVDLKGSFDSVFALIRSVERMDRLVRVGSVWLTADRTVEAGEGPPVLAASLGLEAIYVSGPTAKKEG